MLPSITRRHGEAGSRLSAEMAGNSMLHQMAMTGVQKSNQYVAISIMKKYKEMTSP